jgi:hypothetical protein
MMTNIKVNKKEIMTCRKCGCIFNQRDIKHKEVEQYGVKIIHSSCPECSSENIGLSDYKVGEYELLFNGKFYRTNKYYNNQLAIDSESYDNL